MRQHLVLLSILMYLVTGCATQNVQQPPVEEPPVVEEPAPTEPGPIVLPVLPKPIVGYPKEYDMHVAAEVDKYPALLDAPEVEMKSFCPAWKMLTKAERKQFYVDLMYAITLPESSYDRTSMFNETGIIDSTGQQTVDKVTGKPIVSEGLLQLSYADQLNYGCKFDFPGDKVAFLDDLTKNKGKKSFKSSHPERSILDPYVNLACGIRITQRRLALALTSSEDFRYKMGDYWSTMRHVNRKTGAANSSYQKVVSQFKKRNSTCSN